MGSNRNSAKAIASLSAGGLFWSFLAFAMVSVAGSGLHAQTVLNNDSDTELMYTRLSDENGNATSELYVTKGKAYIENGGVAFGPGKHRLKNVDGRGQYISIVPSRLAVLLTVDNPWVLGFRVDEMKFHWDMDGRRMNIAIVADSLTPHDNTLGFYAGQAEQHPAAKGIAFDKDEMCVVLSSVPGVPYAGSTCYLSDGVSKDQLAKTWKAIGGDTLPPASTENSANAAGDSAGSANAKKELVIKEDGTIAVQDVMVHLTSPIKGIPETLLRNVTLANHFKDGLLLLEIDGAAGTRTGLLYFNKGQSVDFDKQGVPVAGQGTFKLEGIKDGQTVSGWLAPPGSPLLGKKIKGATVSFVKMDSGASQVQLTDVVEASPTSQPDSK